MYNRAHLLDGGVRVAARLQELRFDLRIRQMPGNPPCCWACLAAFFALLACAAERCLRSRYRLHEKFVPIISRSSRKGGKGYRLNMSLEAQEEMPLFNYFKAPKEYKQLPSIVSYPQFNINLPDKRFRLPVECIPMCCYVNSVSSLGVYSGYFSAPHIPI